VEVKELRKITAACMKRLAFRSGNLSSYNYFWHEL